MEKGQLEVFILGRGTGEEVEMVMDKEGVLH